jgi:hypothetical protein
MLATLFLGILVTFGSLAALWIGFIQARKHPRFDKLNSRKANQRMIQLTMLFYALGLVFTIWLMLR